MPEDYIAVIHGNRFLLNACKLKKAFVTFLAPRRLSQKGIKSGHLKFALFKNVTFSILLLCSFLSNSCSLFPWVINYLNTDE
jgi:hypothetical protein